MMTELKKYNHILNKDKLYNIYTHSIILVHFILVHFSSFQFFLKFHSFLL